jgi:NDP-sugar pyrophosphorylase family protein
MKPTLLVLAAGMGSRYGGLKQIDPMGPNGETVLDYGVFDAIRAGFGKVVFIIREDFSEEFKATVGAKFADKIEVHYVFQDLHDLPEGFAVPEGRVKPWGTSHAILAAREVINEPFAVINADDFYGRDGYVQMGRCLTESYSDQSVDHYAIVAYKLGNTLSDHGTVNRGVCSSQDGVLHAVEEYTGIAVSEDGVCRAKDLAGEPVEVSLETLVSMNLWGFSPSLMDRLQEYFMGFLQERGSEMKSECYIPSVVDHLVNTGQAMCHVVSSESHWFGVTYPEDKPSVVANIRQLIDAGEYPERLWDADADADAN